MFCYLGDVRSSGSVADFRRYDSIWGGGGRDLRTKTISVIGNHETATRKVGWIPYWSGKLLSPWPGSLTQTDPPCHAVKLGTWKFIALDTNDPVDAGSAQYDFLVKELTEAGYRSIVLGHHPRWSNGLHGNDANLDDAWKAMVQYGAVAYLSGHDHNCQIQPMRDGGGNPVSLGGTIQFVAGAGGAPLYDFYTGPNHATADRRDNTHNALLRLKLRPTEFVAEFVAKDGTILHSQTFALSSLLRSTAAAAQRPLEPARR